MYIDDCLEGLIRIMGSQYHEPLNLGTDELVTINGLVDMVARIAGKCIRRRHNPSGPQGVRGRNSDNTRLRATLGWEPSIALEQGLALTYDWIASRTQAERSSAGTSSILPGQPEDNSEQGKSSLVARFVRGRAS